MVGIKCKSCGAEDFTKSGGQVICNYCGSTYILEDNERTGKETTISLSSDIDILLDKMRMDPDNAKRYANLILDIDHSNKEIYKYL